MSPNQQQSIEDDIPEKTFRNPFLGFEHLWPSKPQDQPIRECSPSPESPIRPTAASPTTNKIQLEPTISLGTKSTLKRPRDPDLLPELFYKSRCSSTARNLKAKELKTLIRREVPNPNFGHRPCANEDFRATRIVAAINRPGFRREQHVSIMTPDALREVDQLSPEELLLHCQSLKASFENLERQYRGVRANCEELERVCENERMKRLDQEEAHSIQLQTREEVYEMQREELEGRWRKARVKSQEWERKYEKQRLEVQKQEEDHITKCENLEFRLATQSRMYKGLQKECGALRQEVELAKTPEGALQLLTFADLMHIASTHPPAMSVVDALNGRLPEGRMSNNTMPITGQSTLNGRPLEASKVRPYIRPHDFVVKDSEDDEDSTTVSNLSDDTELQSDREDEAELDEAVENALLVLQTDTVADGSLDDRNAHQNPNDTEISMIKPQSTQTLPVPHIRRGLSMSNILGISRRTRQKALVNYREFSMVSTVCGVQDEGMVKDQTDESGKVPENPLMVSVEDWDDQNSSVIDFRIKEDLAAAQDSRSTNSLLSFGRAQRVKGAALYEESGLFSIPEEQIEIKEEVAAQVLDSPKSVLSIGPTQGGRGTPTVVFTKSNLESATMSPVDELQTHQVAQSTGDRSNVNQSTGAPSTVLRSVSRPALRGVHPDIFDVDPATLALARSIVERAEQCNRGRRMSVLGTIPPLAPNVVTGMITPLASQTSQQPFEGYDKTPTRVKVTATAQTPTAYLARSPSIAPNIWQRNEFTPEQLIVREEHEATNSLEKATPPGLVDMLQPFAGKGQPYSFSENYSQLSRYYQLGLSNTWRS